MEKEEEKIRNERRKKDIERKGREGKERRIS